MQERERRQIFSLVQVTLGALNRIECDFTESENDPHYRPDQLGRERCQVLHWEALYVESCDLKLNI